MTTKRGRKSPAPEGASLRQAAVQLGINRKRLLRYLDEGLPSVLHGERRTIDVDDAREWLAAREFEGGTESALPAAKVYHESDPRHALMVATGAIRRIEFEVERGQRVTSEAIQERLAADLGEIGSRLKVLPAMFPVDDSEAWTRERVADAIAPLVEDALDDFRFGDLTTWPQPESLLPDDIQGPDDDDESGRVEYVPLLSPDDPRGRDAAVKAMKAQAKLAMLRESTMDIRDWRLVASNFAEGVRWVVRLLPGLVADAVPDGANIQQIADAMRDKADVIKILIRGPTEDDGIGDVCDGKAFPSVLRMVWNSVESDDGVEFDRPEVADLETVLAALATYPKMESGAEFG